MSGPMTANCLLSVRVEEYQLEMRGACHSYTRLLVILLLQILLIEECATEAITTQFHYLYSITITAYYILSYYPIAY